MRRYLKKHVRSGGDAPSQTEIKTSSNVGVKLPCGVCLDEFSQEVLRNKLCGEVCSENYACRDCLKSHFEHLVWDGIEGACGPAKCPFHPKRVTAFQHWSSLVDPAVTETVRRRAKNVLSLQCSSCHSRKDLAVPETMRLTEPVGTPAELAAFDESVLGPFVRPRFNDQVPTSTAGAAMSEGKEAYGSDVIPPAGDDVTAINGNNNGEAASDKSAPSVSATDGSATAGIATGVAALAAVRAAYMEGSMSASEFLLALEVDLLLPRSLTKSQSDGRPCLAMLAILHSLGGDPEREASLHAAYLRKFPDCVTLCCRKRHCFRCHIKGFHDGITCEQYQASRATVEDVLPCPACGLQLTKGDGCASVNCVCGKSFNWDSELNKMRKALAFAFESEVLGFQPSTMLSASSSAESQAYFGRLAALVVHFNGGVQPPYLLVQPLRSLPAPIKLSWPPVVVTPSTQPPLLQARPHSTSFDDASLPSASPASSVTAIAAGAADAEAPAPAEQTDPAGSVVRASAWGSVNAGPMKKARTVLFQDILARWLPLGTQPQVTTSLIASTLPALPPTSPAWDVAFGSDVLYPEAPGARQLIVTAWFTEKGTDVAATAQQQQEERRAAAWASITSPKFGIELSEGGSAAAAAAAQAAWVYSDDRSARFGAAFKRTGFGSGNHALVSNTSDSFNAEATNRTCNEKETQVWVRARAAWIKLHSAEYSAAKARAPIQLAEAWMALHGGSEARAAAAAVDLLDSEADGGRLPGDTHAALFRAWSIANPNAINLERMNRFAALAARSLDIKHKQHQKYNVANSSDRFLHSAVLSIAVDVVAGLVFVGSEAWTAADWSNCRAWAIMHAEDVKIEKARRWAVVICAAQAPVVAEINEAAAAVEIAESAAAAAAEEKLLVDEGSRQGQSTRISGSDNKVDGSSNGDHQELLPAIRRDVTIRRNEDDSNPMGAITSSPGCAFVSDPVEATVDEELGLRPHPNILLIHDEQPPNEVEERAALEAYLLAFRDMHAARLTVARAMRFQAVALVHHATLKLGYSNAAALAYAASWLPLGSTVRERTEAEAQAAFIAEGEETKAKAEAADRAETAMIETSKITPKIMGALPSKYVNMLRVQVPRGAVAVCMLNEGCDPALLDSVLPPQTAAEAMRGIEKQLKLRLPAYTAGPVPPEAEAAWAVLSNVVMKSMAATAAEAASAIQQKEAEVGSTMKVAAAAETCASMVHQRCVECCVDIDVKEKSVAPSSEGAIIPWGTKEKALRAAWEAVQEVSQENASTTAPATAPATTTGTFNSGRRQEILSALRNHSAAPKPPPCLELAMAKEQARRWVALHSFLGENAAINVENNSGEDEVIAANAGVLVAVEAAVDAQLSLDALSMSMPTSSTSSSRNYEVNRSRHPGSFIGRGIMSGASAPGGGVRAERRAEVDSAYTAPQRLYLAAFKEHWPRIESRMAQCRAHRWEVLAAQVYRRDECHSTQSIIPVAWSEAVQARASASAASGATTRPSSGLSAAAALAVDSTCAAPENAWAWAEAWCLPRGHSGINLAATAVAASANADADIEGAKMPAEAAAEISATSNSGTSSVHGRQLQQAEARSYLAAWRSQSPEAAAAEAREKVARLCAFAWSLQKHQNPFGAAPDRNNGAPRRALTSAYGRNDLTGDMEATLASFHFYGNNEITTEEDCSRSSAAVSATHEGEEWSCGACTLINPILALDCRLCMTTRPTPVVPSPPLKFQVSKLPRPAGVTKSSAKAADGADASTLDVDPWLAASDERDAAVVAAALDLEEDLLQARCQALVEATKRAPGNEVLGCPSVVAASMESFSIVSADALAREVELCLAVWRLAHPAGTNGAAEAIERGRKNRESERTAQFEAGIRASLTAARCICDSHGNADNDFDEYSSGSSTGYKDHVSAGNAGTFSNVAGSLVRNAAVMEVAGTTAAEVVALHGGAHLLPSIVPQSYRSVSSNSVKDDSCSSSADSGACDFARDKSSFGGGGGEGGGGDGMITASAIEAQQLLQDTYSLNARRMSRLSLETSRGSASQFSAFEALALMEARLFGIKWRESHLEESRRADMIECWIDKHVTYSKHLGGSAGKRERAMMALDQDTDTPIGKVCELVQRWHSKKTRKRQPEHSQKASPRSKKKASDTLPDLAAASAPQQEQQKLLPPLPPPEELEAWFKKLREWRCSKCNESFSSPSLLYSHTGFCH